jgi:ureidoglycolate lyase
MIIKAEPLTSELFAPYGQVLMGVGEGSERHNFAADMENFRTGAKPNMTFMRVALSNLPARIETLEQHPHSNQVFIPLNGTNQLVAVCPSTSDGKPIVEKLSAFVSTGSQSINYNARVWHAPRMAISEPGEFIMFRWDDGGPEDTVHYSLDDPVTVELGE